MHRVIHIPGRQRDFETLVKDSAVFIMKGASWLIQVDNGQVTHCPLF